MSRLALSLSLSFLAMAPASAEGIRSLGLSVSPSLYALSNTPHGDERGYAVAMGWELRRPGDAWSLGGALETGASLTAVTPFLVRLSPAQDPLHPAWVRPFVGAGPTLFVPHDLRDGTSFDVRPGVTAVAGGMVRLSERVSLTGQGTYESFSRDGRPLGPAREQRFALEAGVEVWF